MGMADIILLPYDSKSYSNKTSGVFVESIFLGKLIFVTDNTWMSNELINFSLNELIVRKWRNFDLSDKLSKLNKKNFLINFRNMQIYYEKFHNIINFENKLKKIIY